jgi:signal transduction histidine kinase
MTTFNGGGVGRYAPDIEAAVYFAVLEAVQNVAKHASDAAHLSVELIDDGYLRFEVRDDGPGFALAGRRLGAGLTNIRDRIGAVGGDVSIRSAVGEGTSVSGWVPAGASREPAPTPDPVAATMP